MLYMYDTITGPLFPFVVLSSVHLVPAAAVVLLCVSFLFVCFVHWCLACRALELIQRWKPEVEVEMERAAAPGVALCCGA